MDNEVVIRVTFEAKNVDDLKLKIQEYSLAHLGLNLLQLNELRQPIGPLPPQTSVLAGNGQPGVTHEARLNDGKVRLHNPHYPGRAPEIKKKRGRPVGWRKPLESDSVEKPEESQVIQEISTGPSPEKLRAKEAIHNLSHVKGLQCAVEALAEFGAKHLNDLKPHQYSDLIIHIEKVLNEPDETPEPDGAA